MAKKNKEKLLYLNVVIIAIAVGVLTSGITNYVMEKMEAEPTKEELIKEFYDVETATHVSPHGMRKHLGEDPNQIIVDLRSPEEYEEEHIITAVNVPAYKDRDHSDYGAVTRIVNSFKEMQTENPDAEFRRLLMNRGKRFLK